jgi:hypothetical protein
MMNRFEKIIQDMRVGFENDMQKQREDNQNMVAFLSALLEKVLKPKPK